MAARELSGFTLIELVVVIAILAILAAVAIPRFVDLRTEAGLAAAQGMAGALASGAAINFASSIVNTARATTILTCGVAFRAMQGAGAATASVNAGLSFQSNTAIASGASGNCTIQLTTSGVTGTAIANIIGASN